MLVSRPHEGWHWRVFFLAWMAYSMLTVIVFHVEPRYLTPLWTLLALAAIVALGAVFRFTDLTEAPVGGHGDVAWVGINLSLIHI